MLSVVYSRGIFLVYSSSTAWWRRARLQQDAAGLAREGKREQRETKTPKKLHFRDYNLNVCRKARAYFRRKLLVTTVTLDSAIAADASMARVSPVPRQVSRMTL